MTFLMLYYKITKFISVLCGTSARNARLACIVLLVLSPMAVSAESPTELLAQADHLADQNNWYDAGPLYAKAEAGYHRAGDVRNELYAEFGRLHRDIENGSYRTVRAEVVRALGNPVAQNDPLLRIRGLALLGNIDLNTNTAAALEDWNESTRNRTKGRGPEMGEPRAW